MLRAYRALMENVCRNGTMLLNLTQHGRGDLEPEVVGISKDVGAWLKIHGEAVYGSRPFEIYGRAKFAITQQGKRLRHAPELAWRPGDSQSSSRRRRNSRQGLQSRTPWFECFADIRSRRSRLDRYSGGPVQPLRQSPANCWHPRAGFCVSRMTKLGSTMTIRRGGAWMDSPLQFGERRLQQRSHHQRDAWLRLELYLYWQ